MTKYIIHAEIPFLKFEDPYLEPWLKTMQPTFKVRGRQTIRDDCMRKYVEMRKELQVELQNLDSRVCLTSDIWTSSQNLGYMAVTAQYIDAEFKIKKKIIWFKELEYPHSGFAIEEELLRCLNFWGIKENIFTLTLDNASNNTSACDLLVSDCKHDLVLGGEHLHVRCCAHIINILVQDGMKIIHSAIHRIRELLKHVDSSPSRLQVFNSIANGKGLVPKSDQYKSQTVERGWSQNVINTSHRVTSTIAVAVVGSPVLGKRKIEAKFDQYKSQAQVTFSPKSEIEMYLEEETENGNDDFDVLEWWKSRSEKYPVLSAMARDFLAIPLSTVASESAFSCGVRLLGDHRSSLTPEMLEALVCSKDWLFKTKEVELCPNSGEVSM